MARRLMRHLCIMAILVILAVMTAACTEHYLHITQVLPSHVVAEDWRGQVIIPRWQVRGNPVVGLCLYEGPTEGPVWYVTVCPP